MTTAQEKAKAIGIKGVRRVTELFQDNYHLVTQIPSESDEGEDLFVSFKKDGKQIGRAILIQVKSGKSYKNKNKNDYFIPVGKHSQPWLKSTIPIFGVVYDPDIDKLFWANISDYLQIQDVQSGKVPVKQRSALNPSTLIGFIDEAIVFIESNINTTAAFEKLLGSEIGVVSNADYLSYFQNTYGERMIFQQKVGSKKATLYHNDLLIKGPLKFTRDEVEFVDSHMKYPKLYPEGSVQYIVADNILNFAEFSWIHACLEASEWWRDQEGIS